MLGYGGRRSSGVRGMADASGTPDRMAPSPRDYFRIAVSGAAVAGRESGSGADMELFSSKERLLQPSRTRLAFLLLAIAAFGVTEFGRYVYRPYAWRNNLNDLGLADCVGNLGGIGVQIFLGLAVLNATRKQSYRLAVFFAAGYILYEFAQPYLPKGVFDWKDVLATVIGFGLSVLLISAVWKYLEPGHGRGSEREPRAATLG